MTTLETRSTADPDAAPYAQRWHDAARTAYTPEQSRDFHGRFGEGDNAAGTPHADRPMFDHSTTAPVGYLRQAVAGYDADHGLDAPREKDWQSITADPQLGARIASDYQALPDDDPAAHAAYQALAGEVHAQYELLTGPLGVHVDVVAADPYRNVDELAADLRDHHELKVLATASTGGHPFFTNAQNDEFRAVHDAFGHAAIGRGFDRNGEEAAFEAHAQMFSARAMPALATETRGQNSAMVFGGGQGFVDQKVAVLPTTDRTIAAALERLAATSGLVDPDVDNHYDVTGCHHTSLGRTLAVPRQAYSEGQARDFHGRFGEGAGPTAGKLASSLVERMAAQHTAGQYEGMTVSAVTGNEPTDGYIVGTGTPSTILDADHFYGDRDAAIAAVKAFVDAHAAQLADPAQMVGSWADSDHGEVVLDVVEQVADRDHAIELGFQRDEQAIWDVSGGVPVSTFGSGRRDEAVHAAGILDTDAREPARGEAAQAAGRNDRSGTGGVRGADRGQDVRGARRAAERHLTRLVALRRDDGRKLLAGAEVALREALRHAGVRAKTKARNRSGKALADTVAQASLAGMALRPFFAALGTTEAQLLQGGFEGYEQQSAEWLRQRAARQRQVIADMGLDPDDYVPPDDDHTTGLAAAALAAALMALARQRILDGSDARTLEGPGEVTGSVPAGLIARTLDAADGTAHIILGETADDLPDLDRPGNTLEAKVATAISAILDNTALEGELTSPEGGRSLFSGASYVWVHGFYGDPVTDFEPHLHLDGVETNDPEGDDAFLNENDWPPGDYYQPSDHLGCTCELVPQVGGGSPTRARSTVAAALEARLAYSEDQARDAHGRFGEGAGGPTPKADPHAVAAAAEQLLARARTTEPTATADLSALTTTAGGQLAGLDFRLKGADSLERKMGDYVNDEGLTPDQAVDRVNDALRYTCTFGPDRYVDGWGHVESGLEQRGYRLVDSKNYWAPGDAYDGLNTVWRAPSGQKLEVQAHTPESFAAKMDAHVDYERFRADTTSDAERARLADAMAARTARLARPPGVETICCPASQA